MRLCATNISDDREWIFNRVESAGYLVEDHAPEKSPLATLACKYLELEKSDIVPLGSPPSKAAAKAITSWKSSERDDVVERIQKHRTRGVDYWHLKKSDYILVFDKESAKTVEYLKNWTAENKCDTGEVRAKVIKLYRYGNKVALPDPVSSSGKVDQNDLENIKEALRDFVTARLGWTRPPDKHISKGPWRSRQLEMESREISPQDKKRGEENQRKLDECEGKTDCLVRITDNRADTGQLVSITGPKANLDLAEEILRGQKKE
jgi:hypothetical protein